VGNVQSPAGLGSEFANSHELRDRRDVSTIRPSAPARDSAMSMPESPPPAGTWVCLVFVITVWAT
jgi:hypothetical protein